MANDNGAPSPSDDFNFAHASRLVFAELLNQTQDLCVRPHHTLHDASVLPIRLANEMRDAFYRGNKPNSPMTIH